MHDVCQMHGPVPFLFEAFVTQYYRINVPLKNLSMILWLFWPRIYNSDYNNTVLTGMTNIFLSIRILSAAGVVGPLAPSAMIYNTKIHVQNNIKLTKHITYYIHDLYLHGMHCT